MEQHNTFAAPRRRRGRTMLGELEDGFGEDIMNCIYNATTRYLQTSKTGLISIRALVAPRTTGDCSTLYDLVRTYATSHRNIQRLTFNSLTGRAIQIRPVSRLRCEFSISPACIQSCTHQNQHDPQSKISNSPSYKRPLSRDVINLDHPK